MKIRFLVASALSVLALSSTGAALATNAVASAPAAVQSRVPVPPGAKSVPLDSELEQIIASHKAGPSASPMDVNVGDRLCNFAYCTNHGNAIDNYFTGTLHSGGYRAYIHGMDCKLHIEYNGHTIWIGGYTPGTVCQYPPDQNHFAVGRLQNDGNFVIYSLWGDAPAYSCGAAKCVYVQARWATGTWGQPVNVIVMQSDGNLVEYTPTGRPVWASGTAGWR